MTAATPRPVRPAPQPVKVVDAAGRLWRHENPVELYRWVSRRNELLRTIAASPRARSAMA